jgi:phosphate transport system protein
MLNYQLACILKVRAKVMAVKVEAETLMMRKAFRQEMHEMKDDVLLLGSRVENAVMESVQALKDNNPDRSRQVLEDDLAINRMRYEIETSIMVLIATQQPIARDLRTLTASLDICTELERIGDYAKGIATINLRSEGLSMPALLREIYSMAEKAVDMLHRALTTYADEDLPAAKTVMAEDDVIDASYDSLYTNAIHAVIDDPRNIDRVNYVIWAAHNLERLGDRATNICERVFFMITGERYWEIFKIQELPSAE